MGAESSRLSVIWSALDDDHDGFISASQLEDWFRDEAFIGNRLFSPHINGVTSIHQLAQSFLQRVDRDRDERVSYDDLKLYCDGMKEEEIEDLAQSLLFVSEEKKKKAVKKIFRAIDSSNKSAADRHSAQLMLSSTSRSRLSAVLRGYWTQEDAERFIQNEAQYQVSSTLQCWRRRPRVAAEADGRLSVSVPCRPGEAQLRSSASRASEACATASSLLHSLHRNRYLRLLRLQRTRPLSLPLPLSLRASPRPLLLLPLPLLPSRCPSMLCSRSSRPGLCARSASTQRSWWLRRLRSSGC